MLFYGISLIMKEKSNASALWSVETCTQASGNTYTVKWTTRHRQLSDASSLAGTTRPHLGATRPRVGIANLGFEPPSWQCILFIILYLLVKASSLDKQMPTRGRVAPRLGRVPPAGGDASPLAEEYENPSHLLVIY